MTFAVTLAAALCLLLSLVSCTANLKKATCGWSTSIPSNGNLICNKTYKILTDIAHAEAKGRNSAITRHVTSVAVAHRLLAFSEKLRRNKVRYLRFSPSFELSTESRHRILVQGYIEGKWDKGVIDEPESLAERVKGSTITVIGDVRKQQW